MTCGSAYSAGRAQLTHIGSFVVDSHLEALLNHPFIAELSAEKHGIIVWYHFHNWLHFTEIAARIPGVVADGVWKLCQSLVGGRYQVSQLASVLHPIGHLHKGQKKELEDFCFNTTRSAAAVQVEAES